MKTARFATVVAKSGTPHLHITWDDPSRDTELRKAAKNCRLLTVHQEARGSKKDFGSVGLLAGPGAQFFIFPRSLRRFTGHRVVAIEYPDESADQSKHSAPRAERGTRRTKRSAASLKRPPAPIVPFKSHCEPKSPPEPANLKEIRHEIGHVIRALRKRQYSTAREWLEDLNKRLPN